VKVINISGCLDYVPIVLKKKKHGQVEYNTTIEIADECFEWQQLSYFNQWHKLSFVDEKGIEIKDKDTITLPNSSWEWKGEWSIEEREVCDQDGWHYSTQRNFDGQFSKMPFPSSKYRYRK
jgi:hypothetical protein